MTTALLILAIVGWLASALLVVVYRITARGLTAVVALQRIEITALRDENSQMRRAYHAAKTTGRFSPISDVLLRERYGKEEQ